MFENQPINQAAAPSNLPTEPLDMFAGVEPSGGDEQTIPDSPPSAVDAGLLKKKMPAVATMPVESLSSASPVNYPLVGVPTKKPVIGKIILILFILLVIGAAAFGAIWYYGKRLTEAQQSVTQALGSKLNSSLLPTKTPLVQTPTIKPVTAPAVNASTTADVVSKTKNDEILFGEQTDTDKDGIPDIHERELGTDPLDPDTDHDGLTDGEEINIYKTNPTNPDTDGDGLTDGEEVKKWHTDPLNPDSDHDGYPDGKEVRNGYNPLGPGKLPMATSSPAVVSSTSKVK